MTTELISVISKINPRIGIAVSSLTIQKDLLRASWIKNYNASLFNLCKLTNMAAYIDNDNIGIDHLTQKDFVHLKGNGIRQLAQNYISFLRYFLTVIANT